MNIEKNLLEINKQIETVACQRNEMRRIAGTDTDADMNENVDVDRDRDVDRDGNGDKDAAAPPVLVAVSKKQSVEKILCAVKCGQRVFGENRVQEAREKWVGIKEQYPQVELRLIGHLQKNKVKDAVRLFDVIETVDNKELAKLIAREIEKSGRKPNLYIQVNVGEEEQKNGVLPDDCDDFARYCREELGLDIDGLMCIPPQDENPALYFALLGEIARRNNIANLSMGMSGDYETAILCGATHVRIGTAVFGKREI